MRILLKYLILEKNNDSYIINEFANKYILERFLPNSIERNDLYMKVTSNVRNIKRELQELDKKAEQSPDLRKILNDWMADSYGDKIAISKAYSLYSNLLYTLKYEGGTIRDESIQQYINEFNSISRVTIHPYVDFQKAAALSKIELEFRTTQYQKQIKRAYEQCISTTRYNYQHIKNTYSFAIVLWKYGQYLVQNSHDNLAGSRYLEDAVDVFRCINSKDSSYFKCLSQLGNTYFDIFSQTNNLSYKKNAQLICAELNANRGRIDKYYHKYINRLTENLKKYST